MARCPIKAVSDSDVTASAEETLGFDDDTLRGEEKCLKKIDCLKFFLSLWGIYIAVQRL